MRGEGSPAADVGRTRKHRRAALEAPSRSPARTASEAHPAAQCSVGYVPSIPEWFPAGGEGAQAHRRIEGGEPPCELRLHALPLGDLICGMHGGTPLRQPAKRKNARGRFDEPLAFLQVAQARRPRSLRHQVWQVRRATAVAIGWRSCGNKRGCCRGSLEVSLIWSVSGFELGLQPES